MLKLKLQYFSYLMWRANSLEKTLILGKIKGRRRRKQQRTRWLDVITNWMNMNLSKLGVSEGQGSLVHCHPYGHKDSDTTEWLNNNCPYYNSNSILWNGFSYPFDDISGGFWNFVLLCSFSSKFLWPLFFCCFLFVLFFNIYLAVPDLSCSMLVPWAGIKPRPPALGGYSLSHCITREVSLWPLFNLLCYRISSNT